MVESVGAAFGIQFTIAISGVLAARLLGVEDRGHLALFMILPTVCAQLGVKRGRLTGELVDAPPTGEARALIMADYATSLNLDLEESVAYADSASDLPMLEASGHPVAVNPETKLAAIARKRGWHVEHWPKVSGGPRPLLPIGPRP